MKTSKGLNACIFAALVMCFEMDLSAQMQGGRLDGKVTDDAGRPVVGALIEVTGGGVQGVLRAASDLEGHYLIPYLPAGSGCEVRVEASGFGTVVRKGIDIPLGATVSLPFTLAAGGTVVTVTAPPPTVDTRSTTSGLSVTDTLINTLPLSRWAGELAFMAPMAVGGSVATPGDPSVAGSTGAENSYLINGVDVTSSRTGTNGSNLNFDFIQEMQVLTGGLPPEYGATMGGVINAITRSGSNEFHGSAFAYYWSDKTQAESVTYPYMWTIAGNDGYQEYDIGGTLGGYFVKDKLWFYLAYDYNSYKEYTDFPVGPQYGDQYLYLNGKPAQSCFAGQSFTNYSEIAPMYAFKLTWNASPNQKLAFSIFGNGLRTHELATMATLSPITAKYEVKTSPYNLSLQWNSTWSPNFFSELDMGYRHISSEPSVDSGAMSEYLYYYRWTGFQVLPKDNMVAPVSLSGYSVDLGDNYRPNRGFGAIGSAKEESWQGRLKLTNLFSAGTGRHELSYGIQYQKSDYMNEAEVSGPGGFISPSTHLPATGLTVWWQAVKNPGPHGERYIYQANERLSTLKNPASQRFSAAWVNDSWSITDYFTLKLGLRYDQEKLSGERTGNSIDLRDNWAPRLGFTYDVTRDGKSKLSCFAGRYFERVPLYMAQYVLNRQQYAYERFYDPQLTLWTGYSYAYGTHLYVQGEDAPPPGQLTPALASAYSHPLKAPFTDEWILGYEYQVRPDLTLGARLVYRKLGRTIDDLSYDGGTTFVIANPDKWTGVPIPSQMYPGSYDFYTRPSRIYEALELTFDRRYRDNWQWSGSLVCSRLKGNYEGVANNDYQGGWVPNMNPVYDLADTMVNGYGYLPQDRSYELKTYGSYTFADIPLQLSATFHMRSGTPISKQVVLSWANYASFATPRGSEGRLPWLWKLDLGIQYAFKLPMKSSLALRLDIFNVTNEQRTTAIFQDWAYMGEPGGKLWYNPNYGEPYAHQGPRTVRLGLRWNF